MSAPTYDNPIEGGVQQVYIEIRDSLDLILQSEHGRVPTSSDPVQDVLISLDDAISNNWDYLMASFWRGVVQDVAATEENDDAT